MCVAPQSSGAYVCDKRLSQNTDAYRLGKPRTPGGMNNKQVQYHSKGYDNVNFIYDQ